MRNIMMILVLIVAMSANAANNVFVNNTIITDIIVEEGQEEITILSCGLSAAERWDITVLLIETAEGSELQISDLTNFTIFFDNRVVKSGLEVGEFGFLNPSLSCTFAAGSRMVIKANFKKKGILVMNISLAFKKFGSFLFEKQTFTQTINIRTEDSPGKVLGVKDESFSIKICRNDRIITLKNLPDDCKLSVYDISGKLVFTKQESLQIEEVDFSTLPIGIYIISIGDTAYKKVSI